MFTNLIHSLMRTPTAWAAEHRHKRPASRSLAVEPLEDRRLLALLSYTPDNGTETALTINVNEQGAFGYSDDLAVNNDQVPQAGNEIGNAEYNPRGRTVDFAGNEFDVGGTTFASGIAIGFGDYNGDNLAPELVFVDANGNNTVERRDFITAGYIGGRGTNNTNGNNISGTFSESESNEDRLVSTFFYPNGAENETEATLSFRLEQTLQPLTLNGAPNGVVLEQTYTITNVSDEELHFDVIRYMDSDLFAFPGDDFNAWNPQVSTAPPWNGGGMRIDGNLQGVISVFTQPNALLNGPLNDNSIVTIRGNPDDTIGLPPLQINRWEIGRGSALLTPDHVQNTASLGYVTLRDAPDVGGVVTPDPYWKVLHHDWWVPAWLANQAPDTYDPTPDNDAPDQLPLAGTLLAEIVAGDPLANDIVDDQTGFNPDADGDGFVDPLSEYDVAMALRNVYTRVGPGQQVEYYTQTVFGNPPISDVEYGEVSGRVWEDRDGNNTYDPPVDVPLEGWRVFVDYDAPTDAGWGIRSTGTQTAPIPEPSAITGPDGTYRIIGVVPGVWDVFIEMDGNPNDDIYNPMRPNAVGNRLTLVLPGVETPNTDYGLEYQGGLVSGQVISGADGSPLVGWEVLVDADQSGAYSFGDARTYTDAGGNYSIKVDERTIDAPIPPLPAPQVRPPAIPGTYDVVVVAPPNWTITAPAGGSYTETFNVATNITRNFTILPDPFTISGLVWNDENPDGIQSLPAEPGLPNVRVYLDIIDNNVYDVGEPFAVTNAAGNYTFSSAGIIGPGRYDIRVDDRQVADAAATLDQTHPGGNSGYTLTMNAGGSRNGIKFGVRFKRATITGSVVRVPPAPVGSQPGVSGAYIYVDINGDGKPGVLEPAARTLSDGTYRIENIAPGNYTVLQADAAGSNQLVPTAPGGYAVTLDPNETETVPNFGNRVDDVIGVYRPGRFVQDVDGNGAWSPPPDRSFLFGGVADTPIIGDWNGDGFDEIGTHRNFGGTTGLFIQDVNGNGVWDPGAGDRLFAFGNGTDTPIIGDWNGDGRDEIGVHRGNLFILDFNGNGVWDPGAGDRVFRFGNVGDTPVIGDWNNDGRDDIGVHRGNLFILDSNGSGNWNPTGQDQVFVFGNVGDTPIIGNWPIAAPLMAATVANRLDREPEPLTAELLTPLVAEAIGDWSSRQLSEEQHSALRQLDVRIADLPGARLAEAFGTTITLDIDAAGHGWFVDATPWDDSEFGESDTGDQRTAALDSSAYGRADLLTAVMHELGHVLGYGHERDGVMDDTLPIGTRRLLTDEAFADESLID